MNLSFHDLALLASIGKARTLDSFEAYPLGDSVAFWVGGTGWLSGWVSGPGPVGIQTTDDFESYTVGLDITASTPGGAGWPSGFVYGDSFGGVKLQDTIETYATGADPNGLAGGTGLAGWTWAGAWVSR